MSYLFLQCKVKTFLVNKCMVWIMSKTFLILDYTIRLIIHIWEIANIVFSCRRYIFIGYIVYRFVGEAALICVQEVLTHFYVVSSWTYSIVADSAHPQFDKMAENLTNCTNQEN